MIRPEELSSVELALCVDEAVKRAISDIRSVGILSQTVNVQITASQYSDKAEYDISHTVSIDPYGKASVSKTNSVARSAQHAAARWIEDQLDAPTTVRPMITHVKEQEDEAIVQEEVEEAVFTDVSSDPFASDED